MREIFFTTEFLSYRDLILETIGLIGISFFLLWLLNLLFFNRKKKSDISISIRLKLNYLTSLGVLSLLLSIYLSILYFVDGTHSFNWLEFKLSTENIYLRLLPQITVLIGIIILFFKEHSILSKLIKK